MGVTVFGGNPAKNSGDGTQATMTLETVRKHFGETDAKR